MIDRLTLIGASGAAAPLPKADPSALLTALTARARGGGPGKSS